MTDMHPSRDDELLSDLTYWAASPRVPEKVQLLLLEVMGRLTRSETQRSERVSTHWADCWRAHHGCAIAKIERWQKTLEDIASGELGINVSIKSAKKALI